MPTLEELKAEQARRAQTQNTGRLAALKEERARRQSQLIATSPVPTGDPNVDQAGQVVDSIAGGGPLGISKTTLPTIESLPFDDPRAVKAQRAQEGVDFATGLPFMERADIAQSPNVPRLRGQRIKMALEDSVSQLPPQLQEQAFRYDRLLDDWQYLRPTGDGQYRWTSTEGSGIEFADVADMMNPAEFLSMAGAVGAVALDKRKAGTIFAMGRNKGGRAAIQGLTGGLSGRVVGELVSIGQLYMRTGETPTYDEMLQLLGDSAKVELFATATGELGAAIMRTAGKHAQAARAGMRNEEIVAGMAPEQIEAANRNIERTRRDMQRINEKLGFEAMPVTPGTASGSIDIIEAENFAIANANKPTQREWNKSLARGRKGLRDYLENTWGGETPWVSSAENVVLSANSALSDVGTTVAQHIDGNVYFTPLPTLQAEGAVVNATGRPYGAKAILDRHPDAWAIQSWLPEGQRGAGLGTRAYKAAIEEAKINGKGITSDYQVSPDAQAVWERLKKEGYDVVKNPEAVQNKATGELMAEDWVYKIEAPPSVSNTMLPGLKGAQFRPTGEGKVRSVEGAGLADFLRMPSTASKAAANEAADNPWVRQQWKEAILEDYERAVIDPKTGAPSSELFEKWIKETGHFRQQIFDEVEFVRSNQFGALRPMVESSRNAAQNRLDTLARMVKTDDLTMFKDPSQRRLYAQIKSMEPRERRRVMNALRVADADKGVLALFRGEMKDELLKKSKGAATETYNAWLKESSKIVNDIMPAQQASAYLADLRLVGNVLRRRSERALVRGTAAEANPTALALTRVLFGPLSRTQRFFSAARKGQVRWSAADAADIITDPAKLKRLRNIQLMDVESRAVQRWMQDAGVIESFWFGEDMYDIDNPAHRKAVSDQVLFMLQEELSETVE